MAAVPTAREKRLAFRILGPLEATYDAVGVPIAGSRQRALLAYLLLHANRVVATDRLIDELFGDQAPDGALNSVHAGISRLRRQLTEGGVAELPIVTRPPGYLLELGPGQLDLDDFERLLEQGRRQLDAGTPEAAGETLREALGLWRGPALADVASYAFARTEAARLEDLRIAATTDRIEADLASGRHADLVGELESLVAVHPLQERLRGLLMLALYRSGRQADALQVYQDTRRLLVAELGLEPGKALQQLEQRILTQDPALDLAPPRERVADERKPPSSGRRRRPWLVGAVAAGAILVVAALLALALRPDAAEEVAPPVVGNTLVRIDAASERITDVLEVGRAPDRLVATDDAVWVLNFEDRTVSRIDVETLEQRRVGGFPFVDQVTADPLGGIYVSARTRRVFAIDPVDLLVSRFAAVPGNAEGLAFGAGSLWVSSPSVRRAEGLNTVKQVDPETGTMSRQIEVGLTPIFLTWGLGRIWVANYDSDTVSVIEPGSDTARTVAAGAGPLGIATGEGAIWVVAYRDRELVRIDPETLEVSARIPIGNGPLDVAVGAGSVWVTNREDGTLLRIDPSSNEVVSTIQLGLAPHGVVVSDDAVWVTVRSTPYG